MTTPGLLPLDLPLYSRLRQRVAAAPMTAAPGAAWGAWLQAQLRQGLSAHELAASGLEPWLAGQDARVPRAAVLARLGALPTEVQVLLPQRETPAPLVFEALERRCPEWEGALRMRNLVDPCPMLLGRNVAYGFHLARWHVCDLLGLQGLWRVLDARGRPWRSRHLGRLASPWLPSQAAALEWCETVAACIAPGRRAGRPPVVRWSSQRLRGGSDYREWLLTLPGFRFNPRFRGRQHFDVPKLLMHMRTSVQGQGDQRLLFIEEIQSDYNQAISRCERRDGEKISDNAFQAHWVELGLRVALLLACRQGLAGVATSNGAMHDLIYRRANEGRAAFYDEQVARALHKLARTLDLEAGMTTVTGRTQHCLVTPVYEGMVTAMDRAAAAGTAAAATAATTAGTAAMTAAMTAAATTAAGGAATAAAGATAGTATAAAAAGAGVGVGVAGAGVGAGGGAGPGAGAGVAGRAPSAAAVRYWRITGGGQTTEAHLRFPSREQARRYAEVRLEQEVVLPVPVLWLDAAARQRIYAAGLPVLGAVERLASEVNEGSGAAGGRAGAGGFKS